MPREPFCQIAAKAARPTRMERNSEGQRAEEGGQRRLHLQEAKRTIRIDTTTATTAKMARFRDHVARRDTGSDCRALRTFGPSLICRVGSRPAERARRTANSKRETTRDTNFKVCARLELFPFRLDRNAALDCCFDGVFSKRTGFHPGSAPGQAFAGKRSNPRIRQSLQPCGLTIHVN